MPDLFPDLPIDLNQQIASVEREIRIRQLVYPKWVNRGRMEQDKASYEIAAMMAVLKTLQQCRSLDDTMTGDQKYEDPNL